MFKTTWFRVLAIASGLLSLAIAAGADLQIG